MTKKAKGFSPVRKYALADTQVSGVWVEIEDGAASLKIARFNNPEHTAYIRQLNADTKPEGENNQLSEAQLDEIARKGLAKCILKGWKGLLDEDGETELAYSEEAALNLLKLEEFSNLVFSLSYDVERFRLYREEEAAKN